MNIKSLFGAAARASKYPAAVVLAATGAVACVAPTTPPTSTTPSSSTTPATSTTSPTSTSTTSPTTTSTSTTTSTTSTSTTSTSTTSTTSTTAPSGGQVITEITAGNSDSQTARISSGGEWIAFDSNANNLVANDTNTVKDVYLYNANTKVLKALTVGNGSSSSASVATNGDVAFDSFASNLGPTDTNNRSDIYLWENATNTMIQVTHGNAASTDPAISPDGKFIVWESLATNLVAGDTTTSRDIFIWERATGLTTAITAGNNLSGDPVVSNNGAVVSFESEASDLVAGDANGKSDIFLWTKATNTTVALTHASNGSYDPSISADGSRVAFWSFAPEVAPGDMNGGYADVFLWEAGSGITRVTAGNLRSEDPKISADGLFVAFYSSATDLVAGDDNGHTDIFLYTVSSKGTTQVTKGNDDSTYGGVSNGAASIVFLSKATNLTSGGISSGSFTDIFNLR